MGSRKRERWDDETESMSSEGKKRDLTRRVYSEMESTDDVQFNVRPVLDTEYGH